MMNPFYKKNIKKFNSGLTRLNILLYLPLLLILTFPINKTFSDTNDEINLEYLDKENSIDYILGPEDIINIKLSDYLPELTKSVIIEPSGHVSLPKLKRVYIKGLTINELTNLLNKKYSKILVSPQIDIRLIRERPVKVYIKGEVESPGLYTLNYKDIEGQPGSINLTNNNAEFIEVPENFSSKRDFPTIYELIQRAGGVTLRSDLQNIEIIRRNSLSNGGGKIKANINLLSLIESGEFTNNIRLYDGDYIFIGKTDNDNLKLLKNAVMSNLNPKNMQVFVSGRVENPGPVIAAKQATLNDAILLAGGKRAITGKVNFIRINNDGSFEKRKFRYKNNAKRGSYKNPYLKNGDFIVIGKGAVATFNEVLGEITSPFVGIYSATELYDKFTD